MDFWGILSFVFLTVLVMSCCGYCCTSKQRGTVLSTPVVITSATHTAPGSCPVAQIPPNSYQQQVVYPPYPTQACAPGQMPMPMAMPMPVPQTTPGMQPYAAPYPPIPAPMPATAATMNPPSYESAVAGVGAGQGNNASSYEKQPPYNPHYNAH